MKNSGTSSVIILGGGSAGLWSAYELAKKKIDCLLLDQDPMGAYASTRNQGFIHSGAMYVGYDDLSV